MKNRTFDLSVLSGTFSVYCLSSAVHVPEWLENVSFWFLTRTTDEISLVCPENIIPHEAIIKCEAGWACLKVHGPFAFSETGIISALTSALADAGIGVFVVSTFNTDYLLVKKSALKKTVHTLTLKGHRISHDQSGIEEQKNS